MPARLLRLAPLLLGLLACGPRAASPAPVELRAEPDPPPASAPGPEPEPEVEAEAAAEDTCVIREHGDPPLFARPEAGPLTGAVRRTCRRLAASARRTLRAPRMPEGWRVQEQEIARQNEGCEEGSECWVVPLGERLTEVRARFEGCEVAGEGAWMIVPAVASFDESEDDQGAYRIRARMTYVSASGATVQDDPREYWIAPFWQPDEDVHTMRLPSRPEGVFDYDGDGRVDAVVDVHDDWGGDRRQRSSVELYGASETHARRAQVLEGVSRVRWVDYDADGRPDILSDAPYRQTECYEWNVRWGMPNLVVHATDGLAFATDDEVARAWVRELCPCAPTRLLAPPIERDEAPLFSARTLLRLACARFQGEQPQALLDRVQEEMGALEESDGFDDVCAHSLGTLRYYVEPDPPFTFASE